MELRKRKLEAELLPTPEDKETKCQKLQLEREVHHLSELERLMNMKFTLMQRWKQLLDEGHMSADVDKLLPLT
eukprot:CAMPEP_0118722084 /NCGR_PEP_ID=MMETSP0800-20121206/31140_1 /TAXON_ID=210618 ORGANISM="Striatella unipunctata, Strain CCMP2910" /NCGR_SAMPLE_ID=MMETSP0800 /ASSEMBLY_ACC=CAM_ASM_000638 /LENGTH=72 /DNA_ID=CAMNT_0006630137 /DNA_START=805 /DNA_END=1019 /DNA_ORIENTATION=+